MNNWLDKQVSLYAAHWDNVGRPATYREILFTEFWKDLDALCDLRRLDHTQPDYKRQAVELKSNLQCYTPAALLACKAAGNVTEIERTGMMQLDFDYNDISEYDVEELKEAVFDLPFVGFCGLSASGLGFYALVLISEPERLTEYAEHCFNVLDAYGIRADRSKGKKVENLRYLSYDKKMLVREHPEALRIKRFQTKQAPIKKYTPTAGNIAKGSSALVTATLRKIQEAQQGQRWQTVQQAAYTLGGLGDQMLLDSIKNEINNNSAFAGEESKYFRCAEDCFAAGSLKPLAK